LGGAAKLHQALPSNDDDDDNDDDYLTIFDRGALFSLGTTQLSTHLFQSL
jgi:hypothetical protein